MDIQDMPMRTLHSLNMINMHLDKQERIQADIEKNKNQQDRNNKKEIKDIPKISLHDIEEELEELS